MESRVRRSVKDAPLLPRPNFPLAPTYRHSPKASQHELAFYLNSGRALRRFQPPLAASVAPSPNLQQRRLFGRRARRDATRRTVQERVPQVARGVLVGPSPPSGRVRLGRGERGPWAQDWEFRQSL